MKTVYQTIIKSILASTLMLMPAANAQELPQPSSKADVIRGKIKLQADDQIKYFCVFSDLDRSFCINTYLADSLLPEGAKSLLDSFRDVRDETSAVPGANAVHACGQGQVEFDLDVRNFQSEPGTQRLGTDSVPGYFDLVSSTFATPDRLQQSCTQSLNSANQSLDLNGVNARGSLNVDNFVTGMGEAIDNYCTNESAFSFVGGRNGIAAGGSINDGLNAYNKVEDIVKSHEANKDERALSKVKGVYVTKATTEDTSLISAIVEVDGVTTLTTQRIELVEVAHKDPKTGKITNVISCNYKSYAGTKTCTEAQEDLALKAIERKFEEDAQRAEAVARRHKELSEESTPDDDAEPSGDSNESCDGDSCFSCQSIKMWWSMTQQFCAQTNWTSERCSRMVSLHNGCPDRGLIMPNPNGGEVACASSQDAYSEEAAREACEQQNGVMLCENGDCECQGPEARLALDGQVAAAEAKLKDICNNPQAQTTSDQCSGFGDGTIEGGSTPVPTPTTVPILTQPKLPGRVSPLPNPRNPTGGNPRPIPQKTDKPSPSKK